MMTAVSRCRSRRLRRRRYSVRQTHGVHREAVHAEECDARVHDEVAEVAQILG